MGIFQSVCIVAIMNLACNTVPSSTAPAPAVLTCNDGRCTEHETLAPMYKWQRCPIGQEKVSIGDRDFCLSAAAAKAFRRDFPDGR